MHRASGMRGPGRERAGFSHLHRVGGTRREPITVHGRRRNAASWLGPSRLDTYVTAISAEPSESYPRTLYEAFVRADFARYPAPMVRVPSLEIRVTVGAGLSSSHSLFLTRPVRRCPRSARRRRGRPRARARPRPAGSSSTAPRTRTSRGTGTRGG